MRLALFGAPALAATLAASLVACSGAPSQPVVLPPVAASAPPVAASISGTPRATESPSESPTGPHRSPAPSRRAKQAHPTKPKRSGAPSISAQALSLSDLPAGWAVGKADSASSGDSEPACFAAVKDFKRKPVATVDVSFTGPVDHLPTVDESISDAPGQATAALAQAKVALDKCNKVSMQLDGLLLAGIMAPMSFPRVGDQSVAYEVNLIGVKGNVRFVLTFDIIYFRAGDEVALLFFGSLGASDFAQLTMIAARAVAKMGYTGALIS